MDMLQNLREQRKHILEELSSLEQIRRGSIVEQFFERTRKDGTTVKFGPYLLYSFKDKGKTVSKRITESEKQPVYQNQIQAFRRFQELMAELISIGEQISELVVRGHGDEKKMLNSK